MCVYVFVYLYIFSFFYILLAFVLLSAIVSCTSICTSIVCAGPLPWHLLLLRRLLLQFGALGIPTVCGALALVFALNVFENHQNCRFDVAAASSCGIWVNGTNATLREAFNATPAWRHINRTIQIVQRTFAIFHMPKISNMLSVFLFKKHDILY